MYLGFAIIIKFRQTVKTKIAICGILSVSALFVEIKHTYHCFKPDFIFFLISWGGKLEAHATLVFIANV